MYTSNQELPRRFPQMLRCTCLGVVVIVCGLSLWACGGSVVTLTSTTTGQTDGASSQPVAFVTEDGVALSGRLFGGGTAGVVLAHMYPADQTSWYTAAERLAKAGYLVLAFDFRGYGESEGSKDIQHLNRDVRAAVETIAVAGATETVLLGASMGGTACLVAAQEISASQASPAQPSPVGISVTGVVTLSAPVEFKGLSAADSTARLGCPLLFIAAENDVGAEGAAALNQLAPDGDIQIVPGDDHGTDLLSGAAANQVWDLLLTFLDQNLT